MPYINQTYNIVFAGSILYKTIMMANSGAIGTWVHYDGKLCYAFYVDFQTAAVQCAVINPSTKQVCFYSNFPNKILVQYNVDNSYVRMLGNGLFMCYNGNGIVTYFQIPTYFVDNAFVQISTPNFVAQSPCGVGAISGSYFDAVQNIAAFLFVNPLGGNIDDIYVSIYSMNRNAMTKIAGGYLGQFPSGTNPFVKQDFSFPTDNAFAGLILGDYGFQSNGMTQFVEVRSFPNPFYFGGGQQRIHYAGLTCGSPNNGQSFSYFDNTFLILQSQLPARQWGNSLATNLPGIIGFIAPSATGPLMLGNASYGVTINTNNAANFGAFYLGAGKFVSIDRWPQPGDVFGLGFSFGQVQGMVDPVLPPIVSQQASQLLNWHRPISTRGLFKT